VTRRRQGCPVKTGARVVQEIAGFVPVTIALYIGQFVITHDPDLETVTAAVSIRLVTTWLIREMLIALPSGRMNSGDCAWAKRVANIKSPGRIVFVIVVIFG